MRSSSNAGPVGQTLQIFPRVASPSRGSMRSKGNLHLSTYFFWRINGKAAASRVATRAKVLMVNFRARLQPDHGASARSYKSFGKPFGTSHWVKTMTRGLLWLPLLAVFIWLAWAGWNEYQKLEAYRTWAAQFDHAKYDIYAVLGQKADLLTWGKPSRQGPLNLQTFSLRDVAAIQLQVGEQQVEVTQVETPELTAARTANSKGPVALRFCFNSTTAGAPSVEVPFTELELAAQWAQHLYQDWQKQDWQNQDWQEIQQG